MVWATLHHMVRPPSAATPCGDSTCGLRLYFQLLPSHVYSAFGPNHLFSAFAQPCIYRLCPAWCAQSACCRRFFFGKKDIPRFSTMSILEIVRIVRISVYMELGTCLKRRAPKNHEFWRYSDLQISHGEPIGEQNDELKFGHLVFLFPHFSNEA